MFGHYFEVTPINTQPLDHLTTLNGTSNPLIKTEFPIGECGKAYDILKGFSCTTSRLFPDLGGIRRQMMDQEAYGKFQEAYKMLTN